MINSNTVLLHIGKFKKRKRTNLRRAVDECVYASRLYYNKELQSDFEKIEHLKYSQPDILFAALNEYTEYHISFDKTRLYQIWDGVISTRCLRRKEMIKNTN